MGVLSFEVPQTRSRLLLTGPDYGGPLLFGAILFAVLGFVATNLRFCFRDEDETVSLGWNRWQSWVGAGAGFLVGIFIAALAVF